MQKRQVIILVAVAAISLLSVSSVAAATTPTGKALIGHTWGKFSRGKGPMVSGSITAINGSYLTISGRNNTIYTVDITNAKILKGFGSSTSTLALTDIKVGDAVGVIGTLSGTNITATSLLDRFGSRPDNINRPKQNPRLMGTVSNVSGYTFTLTLGMRKSPHQTTSTPAQLVTFIVDMNSTTTVTKDGQTASLGDIANGQTVMITGTIDKTALTATATKVNITTIKPKTSQLMYRFPNGKNLKKPAGQIK